MTLIELRQQWVELWGLELPDRLGRKMLVKSIAYKQRQNTGIGLNPKQQKRLDKLVAQYRRDPQCFDTGKILKPGTQLVRTYQGRKHIVKVLIDGFEYREQRWSSLSKIANEITGKSWNGWMFFGIKS